jgi:hypothetical protein
MIEILERVRFRGQVAIDWERSFNHGQTWEPVVCHGDIPFLRSVSPESTEYYVETSTIRRPERNFRELEYAIRQAIQPFIHMKMEILKTARPIIEMRADRTVSPIHYAPEVQKQLNEIDGLISQLMDRMAGIARDYWEPEVKQ